MSAPEPPVADTEHPPGLERGRVAEPPRRRRRFEPLVIVLPVMAAGFLLTWLHHPRMGLYVVAAAIGAAALLRAVLPARDAGLLVVRSRTLDVAVLAVLTIGVAVLAGVTPFPAPRG